MSQNHLFHTFFTHWFGLQASFVCAIITALACRGMGRNARVSDVVPAMAFLLSDEAGFISGAELPVNGGARY